MGGVGHAFGKLILFGEHAAVYGHPAVGMSLPERTTVRIAGPAAQDWNLDSVPLEDRVVVTGILARLEAGLPDLASHGRCGVTIKSSVARKAGFGSSAALCGAFARATLAHAGEKLQPGEMRRPWALAHDAERLFHGTPSGVDTGLSLLGGTCVLRPRPPGLPEYIKIPRRTLYLVIGAVQRDAACAALVGGLAARVKSGDRAARESIDALGAIAAGAAKLLLSGQDGIEKIIGALADRAMGQLRALGLNTPEMDRLLATAQKDGALGGKLSGAGGGGAFFAVAADGQSASRIASRIEAEAVKARIVLASPIRMIVA